MLPLSYFDASLFVGRYRVKQLFVVSLGAERFWRLAFHDRRGIDSLTWSDVQAVDVRDVCRKDGVGNAQRVRKFKVLAVKLTRADSELALRLAHGVVDLVEKRRLSHSGCDCFTEGPVWRSRGRARSDLREETSPGWRRPHAVVFRDQATYDVLA